MNKIYVEVRDGDHARLPRDLARQIYQRQIRGCALVVSSEPFLFMRVVRKHWLVLLRTAVRERSKSLDPQRILGLTRQIDYLEELRFVTKELPELRSYVLFAEPSSHETLLPFCHSVFVTCELAPTEMVRLRDGIRPGGLLVIYKERTHHED